MSNITHLNRWNISCLYRSSTKCCRILNTLRNGNDNNFRIDTHRQYVRQAKDNGNNVSTGEKSSVAVGEEKIDKLLKDSASFDENEPKTQEDVWSTSPYPKDAVSGQSQALHSFRPLVDPKTTSIILFPGQGAQFVGMGKDLMEYPKVKDMFEIANEILKYDLKKLCLEGPKSELNKTIYCQPAILVTSLAAVERLKDENPAAVENCVATAGFSVGEFAALVFAGSIAFEDAIAVMKVRAEAMQAASELVPSGMMTLFFSPDARINYACVVAKEWCRKLGITKPECRIANYLFPHCKVIAGNEEALQFIEMNAPEFGIRRFKRLAVSGAFHTDLMLPAEEPLREALKKIKIEKPIISVHSNVDGKRYLNVGHIQRGLVEQMSSPVKWEQILHILYERNEEVGFPTTYECGPGKTLHSILKMVNAKAAEKFINVHV